MTRDEQLAFIRQKCLEANPEIVELKFGCQLLDKRSGDDKWLYLHRAMGGSMVVEHKITGIGHGKDYEFDVIGRPIRLADMLLAIGNPFVEVHANGGIVTQTNWPGHKLQQAVWNLRKDDLTEQSDECIEFLADLLK
jgi:hypothetical protein